MGLLASIERDRDTPPMNQSRAFLLLLTCVCFACVPFFDTEPSGEVVDAGADGFVGDGVCCTQTACLVISEEQCSANDGTFQSGVSCEEAGCVPTCADYCGTWGEVCDSRFPEEFGVQDGDCRSYCETMEWESGRFEPLPHPDTNSIGCRLYHMQNAIGSDANRDLHCPHSGASGGQVCGDLCENYCHMANAICSDVDFGSILGDASGAAIDREVFMATFGDKDICSTWCRGEGRAAALATTGQVGDVEGDSIQCRMYHLITAADGQTLRGRATHCAHGSLTSIQGVCNGDIPEPTDGRTPPDE